jgi:SH3-like domain-containing protein
MAGAMGADVRLGGSFRRKLRHADAPFCIEEDRSPFGATSASLATNPSAMQPSFLTARSLFHGHNPAYRLFARLIGFAALVLCIGLSFGAPAHAQDPDLKFGEQIGPVSGLPLPRFVSLKSDRVNLREGPSRDHRTTWVFQRAGLPVEVTAEFDVWCRIRDSEGTEGWVLHSLLSGRRTALVAPWKKGKVFTLRSQPSKEASAVADLQAGVIAAIKSCDGKWCHIGGDGFEGYMPQTELWGVYPNEKID